MKEINDRPELVPIERKSGVTLYGKIMDKHGRLGQFEVHSEMLGNNCTVYHNYTEAKNRMNALIGVHTKNHSHETQKTL